MNAMRFVRKMVNLLYTNLANFYSFINYRRPKKINKNKRNLNHKIKFEITNYGQNEHIIKFNLDNSISL